MRQKVWGKVSKAQQQLFLDIRKWGDGLEVFQEVIFPWCIGPKGAGYRFDIVVPAIKLIVEYDSAIHYRFNKHYHKTKAGLYKAQMRDQQKDKLAKQAGYTLIRVREDDPTGGLDVRKFIERKIRK